MWYKLWCESGHEERMLTSIITETNNRRMLKNAFIFTYDHMRRYCGEWHLETKNMFPNYIFLEAESEKCLAECVKSSCFTASNSTDMKALCKICVEEEMFLRNLYGKGHHLQMSRGVIRNGETFVTEGPLKGIEERIRKIDRHKRLARLAVPAECMQENIWAGLEIVEKS